MDIAPCHTSHRSSSVPLTCRYSDPFASNVTTVFMSSPSKAVALGWLGMQGGAAASQAATLAALTDQQFKALQLWLISLLPTWGSLVYTTWLHSGGGGLLTTRTVYDLLFGEQAQKRCIQLTLNNNTLDVNRPDPPSACAGLNPQGTRIPPC